MAISQTTSSQAPELSPSLWPIDFVIRHRGRGAVSGERGAVSPETAPSGEPGRVGRVGMINVRSGDKCLHIEPPLCLFIQMSILPTAIIFASRARARARAS